MACKEGYYLQVDGTGFRQTRHRGETLNSAQNVENKTDSTEGSSSSGPIAQCKPCVRGCLKCHGPSTEDCYQLSLGQYFNRELKIKHCPIYGCASCQLNGTAMEADVPHTDPILTTRQAKDHQTKRRMICMGCKLGYREEFKPGHEDNPHSNGVRCRKCIVQNCEYCDSDLKECAQCLPGYNLESDGTCTKIKGDGHFVRKTADGKESKDCHSYDFHGQCVDCPKGKKFSDEFKKCVECPDECSGCHFPNKCLSCQDGYFLNDRSMICEPCKILGCNSCMDSVNQCDKCVDGYYFDLNSRKCSPCHKSCATCTGPKKTDCENCSPPYRKQIVEITNAEAIYGKHLEHYRNKFPEIMAASYHMERNFHPREDRYCRKKCLTKEDLGEDFEEYLDSQHFHDCMSIWARHHLSHGKDQPAHYNDEGRADESFEATKARHIKQQKKMHARRREAELERETMEMYGEAPQDDGSRVPPSEEGRAGPLGGDL